VSKNVQDLFNVQLSALQNASDEGKTRERWRRENEVLTSFCSAPNAICRCSSKDNIDDGNNDHIP
jgi:hypothetical protein